jgi:hypothetical protein
MTAQDWRDFIDKLSASRREFAQAIMARMVHVLENFRNHASDDIRKVQRRLDEQKQRTDRRYDELEARIAALEERDAANG